MRGFCVKGFHRVTKTFGGNSKFVQLFESRSGDGQELHQSRLRLSETVLGKRGKRYRILAPLVAEDLTKFSLNLFPRGLASDL